LNLCQLSPVSPCKAPPPLTSLPHSGCPMSGLCLIKKNCGNPCRTAGKEFWPRLDRRAARNFPTFSTSPTSRIPDFWHFAVADGIATLSDEARRAGDEAVQELVEVHSVFYAEIDEKEFAAEMIAARRLVIRLDVDHLYGVMSTTGRRLKSEDGGGSGS
jgi:hypothetical protein